MEQCVCVCVSVSVKLVVPVRMIYNYLKFLLKFVHTFQFSKLGQNDWHCTQRPTYIYVSCRKMERDCVLCDV